MHFKELKLVILRLQKQYKPTSDFRDGKSGRMNSLSRREGTGPAINRLIEL